MKIMNKVTHFFRNRHRIDSQFPLNCPNVILNSNVIILVLITGHFKYGRSSPVDSYQVDGNLSVSFLEKMRFKRLFILHLASTFTSCVGANL